LAWPENGVIFAEGNVRVRGVSNNPPRSLTIVSMGNIFIEGSTALKAASGTTAKLLLMARKNVVLNPTQQIAQVDVQTLLAQPATAGQQPSQLWMLQDLRKVIGFTSITGRAMNRLFASLLSIQQPGSSRWIGPVSSAQDAGQAVRSKTDPLFQTSVGGGATKNLVATQRIQMERFGQVLQRRFRTDTDADVRLALKHSAARQDALVVRYRPPAVGALQPAPTAANLGFKLAASLNTSLVTRSEKFLRINDGTTDLDSFGISSLATGETTANDYSLRWLGGDPGQFHRTRLQRFEANCEQGVPPGVALQ
jgi:hypothetical protein